MLELLLITTFLYLLAILIFSYLLTFIQRLINKNKVEITRSEDCYKISKVILDILLKKKQCIEIEEKNSLISILKYRKNPNIHFIESEETKAILTSSILKSINKSSIFRQLNAEFRNRKFEFDYIQNELITLSTYIPRDLDLIDLDAYGSAIGDMFGTYENKLFLDVLKSIDNDVIIKSDNDLADVYTLIRRENLNKNLILVLPYSMKNDIATFDEEIRKLNINLKYIFVPDLSLYRNKVHSLLLENISTTLVQRNPIELGMILLDNEEIFIQTAIEEEFAIDQFNKVFIFNY